MLIGDSQCTITCVEADNRVLGIWFSNRVAEVQDRMESWRKKDIKVHDLYHWPGVSNIADLATKGRAVYKDVKEGSVWQQGPQETHYPVKEWPIRRDFVRTIPEEERKSAIFGVHTGLLTSKETVPPADGEEDDPHQSLSCRGIQGHDNQTLSFRGIQGLDHLPPTKELAVKDVLNNIRFTNAENVERLYKLANEVMERTNDYTKARRILARVMVGHKVYLPVGSESFRKALNKVAYHPVPLDLKEVAIQRLVLILPTEEQEVNKPVSDVSGGDKNVQSLSFRGIQVEVHPPPLNQEPPVKKKPQANQEDLP